MFIKIINTAAASRRIVFRRAIRIVERLNPYVNLRVGFRPDRYTAIHEKMSASKSLRLCPASASNAIELDNKPKIASEAIKMIFTIMPVLKAVLILTECL
jgi:hypothetical protein